MTKHTDNDDIEAKRSEIFKRKHDEIVDMLVKPGDCIDKVNPNVHIDPDFVDRSVDENWGKPNAEAWFSDCSKRDYSLPLEKKIPFWRFEDRLDSSLRKNNGQYIVEEKSPTLKTEAPVIK